MAAQRKLTQEQEREVALAYLCGVGTDKIQERYDISNGTTRCTIVGKHSLEWNDPLIEFYRQTNVHKRGRNAAHLYLAFCNRQEVPHVPRRKLVDVQRDKAVCNIVEESLYRPGIEQIVEWTALHHYVSCKASPYETFLHTIVGRTNEEQIVRTALTKQLWEEYQIGGPSSLHTVFCKVTDDLVLKIKEGGLGITPTKKKIIEEALQTLPERERRVLGMRFGLDSYDGPTCLDQIGQAMDVSRERIRQVEAKAIRRIQDSTNVKRLQDIAGLCTEQDAQAHVDAMKVEAECARGQNGVYSEIRQEDSGLYLRIGSLFIVNC